MKKIFFCFVLSFFVNSVYAQYAASAINSPTFNAIKPIAEQKIVGNLYSLIGEPFVNFSYDFTDALVGNNPISLFSEAFDELNYSESVFEINTRFAKEIEDELEDKEYPLFTNKKEGSYTFKFYVVDAHKKGSHNVYAILFDNSTSEILYQKFYKLEGGVVGKFVNLLGDAAQELAEQLGKDIKRSFKEYKKRRR